MPATPSKPKAPSKSFEPVYRRLKAILDRHRKGLEVHDDHQGYALWTGYHEKFKKPLYFAGVRLGKSYVSYYLMGVYMAPDLEKQMPEALKKRMQGKACFNFTKVDDQLFAALDRLTATCRKRWEKEGLM
jgi:hypothetical protein